MDKADEAVSEQTRRTRLLERWSAAGRHASPFGFILRPAPDSPPECPFPSWKYTQAAMPGFSIQIAESTGLMEPMWCYMESGRPPAEWPVDRRQPLEHLSGFQQLTRVRLIGPQIGPESLTAKISNSGLIAWQAGDQHLLFLEFDGAAQHKSADFRPHLPLVFEW